MAYLFVPFPVTLDDLEGHSRNAGLIKCNSTNICATLARFCHVASRLADEKSSRKGAWSGSREQFVHCGRRKFRHSKSSVDR